MYIGYIYRFYNKITQKNYIGQTTRTINERVMEHIKLSKNNKDNNYFHSALNKYGIQNFEISILHTIDAETKDLLLKKLNVLEVDEIRLYNSFYDGYNSNTGGNNYIVSEETKKKVSMARKGIIFSEEHKKKISEANRNKKKAPRGKEYCEKLRQRMKKADLSKLHSKEAREKARLANLGKKRTDEVKLKMSKAQKGRIVSAETREKLRKINLGKKHKEETKEKLRLITIENSKNPEYIRKISEGVKKNWIKRKEKMLLEKMKSNINN